MAKRTLVPDRTPREQKWDQRMRKRAPMLAYACDQIMLEVSYQALEDHEFWYCANLLEILGEKIGEMLGTIK